MDAPYIVCYLSTHCKKEILFFNVKLVNITFPESLISLSSEMITEWK